MPVNSQNLPYFYGQLLHEGYRLGLTDEKGFPVKNIEGQLTPAAIAFVAELASLDLAALQQEVKAEYEFVVRAAECDPALRTVFGERHNSKEVIDAAFLGEVKESETGIGSGVFTNESRDQVKEQAIERFKAKFRQADDAASEDQQHGDVTPPTAAEFCVYRLLQLQDHLLMISSAMGQLSRKIEDAALVSASYSVLVRGLNDLQKTQQLFAEARQQYSSEAAAKPREEKISVAETITQEQIEYWIERREELTERIIASQKNILSQMLDVAHAERADQDTQAKIRFSSMIRTHFELLQKIAEEENAEYCIEQQKNLMLRLFKSPAKEYVSALLTDVVRSLTIKANLDKINFRKDQDSESRLTAVETEWAQFSVEIDSKAERYRQLHAHKAQVNGAVFKPAPVVVVPPPPLTFMQQAGIWLRKACEKVGNFFKGAWRCLFNACARCVDDVEEEQRPVAVVPVTVSVASSEKETVDRTVYGSCFKPAPVVAAEQVQGALLKSAKSL